MSPGIKGPNTENREPKTENRESTTCRATSFAWTRVLLADREDRMGLKPGHESWMSKYTHISTTTPNCRAIPEVVSTCLAIV